jgi:rhodanese-related sulfurtransferase
LRADEDVDLGGLRLRALATPGHTPEHLAYLLLDGDDPVALFSGGSLLVGAVARTDLISPDRTEALTRQLWRSLQDGILSLPDDLPVFPTHGAGSFCSAAPAAERWTTIGAERASNPLLAAADEDAFVTGLLGRLGTYPPYFVMLREVNRRGPTVYGDHTPVLPSLAVDDVRRLMAGGAELVDVRPFRRFAAGHIPGSLSIPLRPQLGSWLGWLVPPGRAVVFVADANQDRAELVRQCLQIGYEDLAGELAGGIDAWAVAGRPLEQITVVEPAEVSPSQLLDVRQDGEFESGHVPGSAHLELGAVAEAVCPLASEPMTLMCGHGERAMTAASLLTRAGRRDVRVLAGGPSEWSAATGRALATGGR